MEKQNIEFLINQILPKSSSEFRNECIKNFQNNGINNSEDLLNKIGGNSLNINELTNDEKAIIKSLYEKDFSLDDILESLINPKTEQIKKYYQSIRRPKKPIPKELQKIELDSQSLPCFLYPSKKIPGKKYYTLLLLGETGSGKTTLLDAFANYLSGIEFDDEWRYRLSYENKHSTFGYSKTNQINTYYINYDRDNKLIEEEINIRIIDTPGFDYSRGILYDIKIIKQLKKLFKEIRELDYILIVTKSHIVRLSLNYRYILDRIQELFGKDVIERLMLICTFSDGQKPPIINTINGFFPYKDYFCFNNSCLYESNNNNINDYIKLFWKIGITNIKKLLEAIVKKNFPPLILDNSTKVIESREELFDISKNSKERINETLINLEKYNNILKRKGNTEKESHIELAKKIKELIITISVDIKSTKKYLSELDEIALKPRVFLDEDFFDLMLEYEKQEKMPEWENRIKALRIMKEQVQQINKLSKVENVYQIFPQYNNVLKELNIK